MDTIQRALDLSRRQRGSAATFGISLVERPELLQADPHSVEPPQLDPLQPEPEPLLPPVRLAIDAAHLASGRIVFAHDRSAASRAYRMLRAQVLQRVRVSGLRAIGVVSAVAGEGKTVTAINLALSLASEPNQSVALVDLDLRRPALAKTLGVAPSRGLDEWIHDASPVSDVLFGLEGIERLQIVPTLAPVPASTEALAGERVRELLRQIRARSDSQLLIVDQPPALLSADVLTLAPQLDGYIMVVTENRTRREDVARVFQLLGRDRLIGTVLNRSADSEQRAY